MSLRISPVVAILVLLFLSTSMSEALRAANPDTKDKVSIEIYNRDQALIHEIRSIDLDKGDNIVDFHEISEAIYGHSVWLKPVDHQADITEISTEFKYDLIDHEKLISKFIGRWFTFEANDMVYEGKLLRIDDMNLFLQSDTTDPMIEVIDRGGLNEMFYPDIPEGLVTQPTIRWTVHAKKKIKDQQIELSYLTSDISWMCDYRAEILDDSTMSLASYFTIDNQLPLTLKSANIALVAGSTHRSQDPDGGDFFFKGKGKSTKNQDINPQRIFEYYRFPIEHTVDLIGNQSIQIPYFQTEAIKISKKFVLPHLLEDESVRVRIVFINNKDNNLGRPLPEGDIGLYKRTDKGALSFLGEDYFSGQPSGGEIELDVGSAFDITAHRIRIAQARPQRDRHEETWQVEIQNNRQQEATVFVEQRVFGYFEVTEHSVNGESLDYIRESAEKLIFPVKVGSQDNANLMFTISYGY